MSEIEAAMTRGFTLSSSLMVRPQDETLLTAEHPLTAEQLYGANPLLQGVIAARPEGCRAGPPTTSQHST